MEQIRIDLVPGGVTPNAHASQYDVGRAIRFLLYNGGNSYTLAGTETITVDITKPDGTTDTVSVTNTSSNYVDFVTTDGLLNQAGLYPCEISIVDGGTEIGSQNFNLRAEADAYDGADIITVTVGPADICTFTTNLAEPLQSVTVDITATGGNGTPDNPNPINGYTEANITRCGVNFLNLENSEQGGIDPSGVEIISTFSWRANALIRITPDVQYTLSVDSSNNYLVRLYFYDSNGNFISPRYQGTNTVTATPPSNAKYCKWVFFTNADTTLAIIQASQPQLETGATRTTYTPYNGQTYAIAFGQTVYGGVLDVTRGKLTVTWGSLILSSLDNWIDRGNGIFSSNISSVFVYKPSSDISVKCEIYDYQGTVIGLSGMTDKPDKSVCLYYNSNLPNDKFIYIKDTNYTDDLTGFVNSLNGKILIAELATPFDIDLTPEVISAIVGTNNVFADCGKTTMKYLKAGD